MKYHEKKFKKKERNVKNIVPFRSLHPVFVSLMTSTASAFTPLHLCRNSVASIAFSIFSMPQISYLVVTQLYIKDLM